MINFPSDSSEPGLLKALLEPLLEDFQYWFQRARLLLETQTVDFLGSEQQAELLAKVQQAQRELETTQALFKATEGQVGVDTAVLLSWHQLVTACWQVGIRYRMEHPELTAQLEPEGQSRLRSDAGAD